jgi:hypothetical protein
MLVDLQPSFSIALLPYLSLGLQMLLFPSGMPSRIFCGTLLLFILRMCPSHSILLDLISATMCVLLHRFSIFLLHLICHVPFIHTEPYILRKIFLSHDMRIAVDFFVSVQVSLSKRTAGSIIVIYTYTYMYTYTHTECSLCRLIRLLGTWCRSAAFFPASGAALSQEVPTVKWMPNQPALWTLDIYIYIYTFWFSWIYILLWGRFQMYRNT